MHGPTLITAATGVLGRAVVAAAVEARLLVRQGVRDLAKANPHVDAVRFDYADPASIEPALDGTSAMVLIAPPLDPDAPKLLAPVIAVAKKANLQQILFISVFGVNHNEQAPLRVIEHLVMDSGVPFTILRPNFFMNNFSEGFLAPAIREHNAIYLAADNGKTSFIAAEDVADVVVESLRKALVGREIDLTGPKALDHSEVARIIGDASGRRVVYHSLTEGQMLDGARSHGMPEPTVAYLAVLYAVVRAGLVASTADGYEKVTGRQPRTFDAFARSAAAAWK